MSCLLLISSYASLVICDLCLILKSGIKMLSTFPTIQKPYCGYFCDLAIVGASDAMKPERFFGQNFHRWQTRVKFWLMSLGL